MLREHPNFAKIKFVVGVSCSLTSRKLARSQHYKINLHIWDASDATNKSRGFYHQINIDQFILALGLENKILSIQNLKLKI